MNLGELNAKKTLGAVGLSGVLTVGGVLTFLDTRYALAMDVQQLVSSIQEERIERLEFEIADCDRRLRHLRLVPEEAQDGYHSMRVEEVEAQRELYIRKLERLTGE